ncbi:MAG: NAD(P)H-dependent oxidoreductase subunit E [Cytophagales bacterium]|nr:NAD(P)H-dependent oxidoreductase subunit E [Cytophagales bacterium]
MLLSQLWNLQTDERHVSKSSIEKLAQQHRLSEIEIEGVASFYHFFHKLPAGKHTIYLNTSIISQLKGFERIRETFERETGARLGSADPSGTFGLYQTPCIGLSDQEPAALIDFYPFTNLNALKVKEIIQKIKHGKSPQEICDQPLDNIRFTPANNRTIFLLPASEARQLVS